MMFYIVALLLSCLTYQVLSQECSENICYPGLGCYDNCPPFTEFPLPKPPAIINTQFFLYNRANRQGQQITAENLGSFNSILPTQFVLHGFAMDYEDDFVQNLKNEALDNGDYNYIAVDWSGGAFPDLDDPLVPYPASNARVVGRVVANIVRAMQIAGLPLFNVHCIGFSAGGQACAMFGKEFPNPKIGRITGLDPAGAQFDMDDARGRLAPTDATYVDVIHTNGVGALVAAGINRNCGHVDFWPNKGEGQPGCVELGIILVDTCSHVRSTSLFIESVNSVCRFTSDPCASLEDMREGNCPACSLGSCQYMGWHSNTRTGRGTHLLTTSGQPPFCQN